MICTPVELRKYARQWDREADQAEALGLEVCAGGLRHLAREARIRASEREHLETDDSLVVRGSGVFAGGLVRIGR